MTLTDIANIALTDIGADEIQSIDDTSKVARIVKKRLSIIIYDIQVLRDWSCLVKTIKLNPRCGETPEGEREFNLPKSVLRIIGANPQCRWRREAGVVIAPVDDLKLKCVCVSENPNEWDVVLRNAIVGKLEAAIALPLTQNADLARNYLSLAERTLSRAMAEDELNSRATNKNKKFTTWFD